MKTKRFIVLVLVILMTISLVGCGSKGGNGQSGSGSGSQSNGTAVESCQTIGELMDLGGESVQWSTSEQVFVYAMELDGEYYRAIAEMTAEQSDALFNVDYNDENYEEQENEIVRPLEITRIDHLNDEILSQSELDALVGKTGQELFDAGWRPGFGYNLEDMEFWMYYGPFTYAVVFDGEVADADVDTFDEEEDIKDMVVKSAEFYMLGDATSIDE